MSDDDENNMYLLTSDQVTAAQINQLKEEWQKANAELVRYKELAFNLQTKIEKLSSALESSEQQLELEAFKSYMAQICATNPSSPILLVKELAKSLPKFDVFDLVATAFIRTGESWIALSSSSIFQETITFRSRIFEEMLRFRSRNRKSKVTVDQMTNILPAPVINYIHSG
jgi:tRNA U34 5-methylaminomethyl-2-thiouridine-forming methyltransferase MnmC